MRILYVEDQVNEQTPVAKVLGAHHHEVTIIDNVFAALEHLRFHQPDLLLCDYQLGDGPNGLFVAENARNLYPACTIVMISCHLSVENTVHALHIGADDFVQRPISLTKLLERLWEALTRHQRHYAAAVPVIHSVGSVVLDKERWTASWHNQPLELTPTEFAILVQLNSKPNQLIAFSDLWANSRGERLSPHQAREILKPHISKLRAKLIHCGSDENIIRNVRGKGYLWSPE